MDEGDRCDAAPDDDALWCCQSCHLQLNHLHVCTFTRALRVQKRFYSQGTTVNHSIYGRQKEQNEQLNIRQHKDWTSSLCVCMGGEIYSHFGRRVSEAHCQLHLVFVSPEHQTPPTLTNVSAVYQDDSPSRRTALENKLRTWNIHSQ